MSNKVQIAMVIILIICIIALDILVGKCTDNFINETEEYLANLKQALIEEDYSESKNRSEKLKEKWDESENKLAYFIEHDELEKISSQIAIMNENTNNKEYKLALEDNIETKFLLEHVKDKLKLKIKNVF